MSVFKCTAAGDAMLFRPLPGEYEGFREIRDFISKGDFRFLNLETTVHRFETWGNAVSGGTWFCADPAVLGAVREFNFNILTNANNHTEDYGIPGLLKTIDYVREAGFPMAGTGRNLAEASAPVYLDTMSGRYALIAATTSFSLTARAGEQTRSMQGRPGVNVIRHSDEYHLTKKQMEALKQIADDIDINASDNITRAEGYLPQLEEGEFKFGTYTFRENAESGAVSKVNEADMRRMERAISEAKYMADYVVISIHSHQLKGKSKETPAQFLEECARRCIDAGANAVIGTGPHLLRPVEIYKGCPIFYSLGDFILENETIQNAPAEFYEKQNLDGNSYLDLVFDKRSGGGQRGLYFSRKMFETVVPYWEAEDGKLTRLELMPAELHFGTARSRGGLPSPDSTKGIIERLAEMSEPYGTNIRIENGIGIVEL